MSFLFGGGGRVREDHELAEANRRGRMRMARDLGDERTLAGERPTARRNRSWIWLAAATAGLAVLAVTSGGRGEDVVPLAADCTAAHLGVQSSLLAPDDVLRFRLAGPDGGYTLTLDGAPVQAEGVGPAGNGGETITLAGCLSPVLQISGPDEPGQHRLAVQRTGTDGSTAEVAATTVTVRRPG